MKNKLKEIIDGGKAILGIVPKKIKVGVGLLIALTIMATVFNVVGNSPCEVDLTVNPIEKLGVNPSLSEYLQWIKCYFEEFVRRVDMFPVG